MVEGGLLNTASPLPDVSGAHWGAETPPTSSICKVEQSDGWQG